MQPDEHKQYVLRSGAYFTAALTPLSGLTTYGTH